MVKLWITMVLFAATALVAGNVRVQVSSTRVAPGESVTVKLIADGKKVRFPQIRAVGPYPVENLRTLAKQEMRFENGHMSTKSRKILRFVFYPEKTVTLPSWKVTVDGRILATKPTTIRVDPRAAASGGFAVRMHLDKKELFLGEPATLTIDVDEPRNGPVSRIEFNPPPFKDFFVRPIGTERVSQRGSVTVHELHYLLIPKKVGRLRIEPARIRVGIRDMNAPSDPFGIFGAPLKWHALRSEPITILVKPVPPDTDLVGRFSLKATVDHKTVKANQPVNYTLTIRGEGSVEDLVDPRFDIPGVTVYADDPKVRSTVRGGTLHSVYTKHYAFLSDRDFTIPPVTLRVFDPKTGKSRTLSTPAIAIHVTGGAASGARAAPPAAAKPSASSREAASPGAKKRSTEGNASILEDRGYLASAAKERTQRRHTMELIGAFLTGMGLMGLLALLWSRRPKRPRRRTGVLKRHYGTEEALRILYPHINEDPTVERVVRQLLAIKKGQKKQIDRNALDALVSRYDSTQ
ncbi:BatD family protein [Nitratifractor sp.]